jgi:hypothetical protein
MFSTTEITDFKICETNIKDVNCNHIFRHVIIQTTFLYNNVEGHTEIYGFGNSMMSKNPVHYNI